MTTEGTKAQAFKVGQKKKKKNETVEKLNVSFK